MLLGRGGIVERALSCPGCVTPGSEGGGEGGLRWYIRFHGYKQRELSLASLSRKEGIWKGKGSHQMLA